MDRTIQGFVLGSVHEKDRIANIDCLKATFSGIQYEEAVYPRYEKIPFLERMKKKSFERTGHALNNGEIGCLMSHRRIWKKIASSHSDDETMFLVLESDSSIQDVNVINDHFKNIEKEFDIFFWGAWEGHMKLFRSTKKRLSKKIIAGEPYIESVYCTYGYSLNKKAAAYLLQKTRKISYPVDQFRKFVAVKDLKIGGVMPELITTIGRNKSYIQENRNSTKEFFRWLVLDARNALICMMR